MTDRAVTHALIIDNPFSDTHLQTPQDNRRFYEDFVKKNLLTDVNQKIGFFNRSILCLLMLELCSCLNLEGDLIFDTAYLEKQHVEFISSFFSKHRGV